MEEKQLIVSQIYINTLNVCEYIIINGMHSNWKTVAETTCEINEKVKNTPKLDKKLKKMLEDTYQLAQLFRDTTEKENNFTMLQFIMMIIELRKLSLKLMSNK